MVVNKFRLKVFEVLCWILNIMLSYAKAWFCVYSGCVNRLEYYKYMYLMLCYARCYILFLAHSHSSVNSPKFAEYYAKINYAQNMLYNI